MPKENKLHEVFLYFFVKLSVPYVFMVQKASNGIANLQQDKMFLLMQRYVFNQ